MCLPGRVRDACHSRLPTALRGRVWSTGLRKHGAPNKSIRSPEMAGEAKDAAGGGVASRLRGGERRHPSAGGEREAPDTSEHSPPAKRRGQQTKSRPDWRRVRRVADSRMETPDTSIRCRSCFHTERLKTKPRLLGSLQGAQHAVFSQGPL